MFAPPKNKRCDLCWGAGTLGSCSSVRTTTVKLLSNTCWSQMCLLFALLVCACMCVCVWDSQSPRVLFCVYCWKPQRELRSTCDQSNRRHLWQGNRVLKRLQNSYESQLNVIFHEHIKTTHVINEQNWLQLWFNWCVSSTQFIHHSAFAGSRRWTRGRFQPGRVSSVFPGFSNAVTDNSDVTLNLYAHQQFSTMILSVTFRNHCIQK